MLPKVAANKQELKISHYKEPITFVRYVNPDGSLGGLVPSDQYPPPDHWVLHEDTVDVLSDLIRDTLLKQEPPGPIEMIDNSVDVIQKQMRRPQTREQKESMISMMRYYVGM